MAITRPIFDGFLKIYRTIEIIESKLSFQMKVNGPLNHFRTELRENSLT